MMSLILRLRPHLHVVILCLCWYTISSIGSRVTKQILMECPLPLFLGEFQFIYTSILAALSCSLAYHNKKIYDLFPIGTFPHYHRHPSEVQSLSHENKGVRLIITRPSKQIITTVLPLGLFQFVGKYFGHTATALVPVSTVASIKTLSPVFILLIQKSLRISTLPLSSMLWLSLFSIVMGVWIIVSEDSNSRVSKKIETQYSSTGVICAIISMFIFVGQNIYGKKVFTFKSNSTTSKDKEESPLPTYSEEKTTHKPLSNQAIKYDKLTLMIYISMVGFSLSLGWFSFLELPILWNYLVKGIQAENIKSIPWNLFFVNGTFHFIQAMIAFHLLGEVSTLTYSIANLMKRIAIISVSWTLSGVGISFLQVFGLILNAFGLFLYEKSSSMNKIPKRRPE